MHNPCGPAVCQALTGQQVQTASSNLALPLLAEWPQAKLLHSLTLSGASQHTADPADPLAWNHWNPGQLLSPMGFGGICHLVSRPTHKTLEILFGVFQDQTGQSTQLQEIHHGNLVDKKGPIWH